MERIEAIKVSAEYTRRTGRSAVGAGDKALGELAAEMMDTSAAQYDGKFRQYHGFNARIPGSYTTLR